MNAVVDLEQLLILYSRLVDAPKGSEEFSTAVRLLRESMTADDGRNHILRWPSRLRRLHLNGLEKNEGE